MDVQRLRRPDAPCGFRRSLRPLAGAALLAAGCAPSAMIRPEAWRKGARVAIVSFDVADKMVQYDMVVQTEWRQQQPSLGTPPPAVTPAAVQWVLGPAYDSLAAWISRYGLEQVPPAEVAAAEMRLGSSEVLEGMAALSHISCLGVTPGAMSIAGPVALALTPALASALAAATRADIVLEVHTTVSCGWGGAAFAGNDAPWLFAGAFDRTGRRVWRAGRSLWNYPIGPGFMPPPLQRSVRSDLDELLSAAELQLGWR